VSDAADRIRSGILLDATSGIALILSPGKSRAFHSLMDIRGKRVKYVDARAPLPAGK
jgi:hypothetical protein